MNYITGRGRHLSAPPLQTNRPLRAPLSWTETTQPLLPRRQVRHAQSVFTALKGWDFCPWTETTQPLLPPSPSTTRSKCVHRSKRVRLLSWTETTQPLLPPSPSTTRSKCVHRSTRVRLLSWRVKARGTCSARWVGTLHSVSLNMGGGPWIVQEWQLLLKIQLCWRTGGGGGGC